MLCSMRLACVSRTCRLRPKKFFSHWKKRGNFLGPVSLMRRTSLPAVLAKALFVAACAVTGCSSEILERQAQQIKEQETEITRQRKEIDELLASRQAEQQKQRDC